MKYHTAKKVRFDIHNDDESASGPEANNNGAVVKANVLQNSNSSLMKKFSVFSLATP